VADVQHKMWKVNLRLEIMPPQACPGASSGWTSGMLGGGAARSARKDTQFCTAVSEIVPLLGFPTNHHHHTGLHAAPPN
jgi:hypothetical protein